jgi:hypothetical protein
MRAWQVVVAIIVSMCAATVDARLEGLELHAARSYVGKNFLLKVDLVEAHLGLRGVDATNVSPTGEVVYRATLGDALRQSRYASAADLIAYAQENSVAVRVLGQGTEVRVESIKLERQREGIAERVFHVQLEDVERVGHSVRIIMSDYESKTADDFDRMFHVVFAESEQEYREAIVSQISTISAGASVTDVIMELGSPKVRIELPTKVVLFYDGGLKLVFHEGRLIDAD